MNKFSYLLLIIFLISPCQVFAETVSFTNTDLKDHGSAISKWCKGDKIHFSTANLTPSGYEPCGQVSVKSYCDPMGNKYIGDTSKIPYAYQDCSQGPRMYMERNGVPVDIAAAMKKDLITKEEASDHDYKAEEHEIAFDQDGVFSPQNLLEDYFNALDTLVDDDTYQPKKGQSKKCKSKKNTHPVSFGDIQKILKPFLEKSMSF